MRFRVKIFTYFFIFVLSFCLTLLIGQLNVFAVSIADIQVCINASSDFVYQTKNGASLTVYCTSPTAAGNFTGLADNLIKKKTSDNKIKEIGPGDLLFQSQDLILDVVKITRF